MLREIEKEIKKYEEIVIRLKGEVKNLPKGKLRCTNSNGTTQFYVNNKYTSKDNMKLIRGIAQREYDEKTIDSLKKLIKELYVIHKLYEEESLEKHFDEMCQARKNLLVPAVENLEMKVQKFMSEEYLPGQFDEGMVAQYITQKGERVRSKSELIIADSLYRKHIPYRYEKPLELNNGRGIVTVRPDFTIMNSRTGNIIIYEHLGMMDDAIYVEKNMKKLNLYERNGYLIGKNLIITHETSTTPLNNHVIDEYIDTFFL